MLSPLLVFTGQYFSWFGYLTIWFFPWVPCCLGIGKYTTISLVPSVHSVHQSNRNELTQPPAPWGIVGKLTTLCSLSTSGVHSRDHGHQAIIHTHKHGWSHESMIRRGADYLEHEDSLSFSFNIMQFVCWSTVAVSGWNHPGCATNVLTCDPIFIYLKWHPGDLETGQTPEYPPGYGPLGPFRMGHHCIDETKTTVREVRCRPTLIMVDWPRRVGCWPTAVSYYICQPLSPSKVTFTFCKWNWVETFGHFLTNTWL